MIANYLTLALLTSN